MTEAAGWTAVYPRPQLRRERFLVLHDGWTLNGQTICLPWPPQAAESGYSGAVGSDLHYETYFSLPPGFLAAGERLLLHFGAVDQIAEVAVNGIPVIRHEGGYLPFSADITGALRAGENHLTILVQDTLSHRYPYGKQHKRPHGMWYTPVSGIWQTVWLEPVPAHGAVAELRMTPDLTGITLAVDTDAPEYTVTIPLGPEETLTIASGAREVRIDLPAPRLWSPEDPFLYSFTVTTASDRVESYFALRTVTREERDGHLRLCLNGTPVFLHGVLDQGYFPGGLFLPERPADYEQDILRMKALGFNTLRKHIKIEPEVFYAACDRLGMLVVQDMVNSGGYSWLLDTAIPNVICKKRFDRFPGSRKRRTFFEAHTLETQRRLYNHPCIVGYTIFNEGWGQYDADRMYRMCRKEDPTRFYDSTSGWFAQHESDVQSEHIYFRNKVLHGTKPGQFLFLSECGGYTRPIAGHLNGQKNYGYGQADSEAALTERIQAMYREMVLPSIPNGLCGSVYTQLSDVEGEINGLYTFDRAVCKVNPTALREISREIYLSFEDLPL